MAKTRNKLPVTTSSPAMPVVDKPSASEQAEKRRYRAEDAMRDLERAERHKGDKDLMRDVKQLAKEKIATLGKIK